MEGHQGQCTLELALTLWSKIVLYMLFFFFLKRIHNSPSIVCWRSEIGSNSVALITKVGGSSILPVIISFCTCLAE